MVRAKWMVTCLHVGVGRCGRWWVIESQLMSFVFKKKFKEFKTGCSSVSDNIIDTALTHRVLPRLDADDGRGRGGRGEEAGVEREGLDAECGRHDDELQGAG